ncbi:hypothetical protein ACFW1F_23250 [Streptomyces bungoensis]|uniref:hypothetical protein n=1 Tax=Streptomyces bungoensis TaxID=285568 RepID=UPI003695BE46
MGPDPVPHEETAPERGAAAAGSREALGGRGEAASEGREAVTGPGHAGAGDPEREGGREDLTTRGREVGGAVHESTAEGREPRTGGRATPEARREVVTADPGRPRAGLPPPRTVAAPGAAAPVAALMRRQLRAALTAVALLAVSLGLLPVLLAGTGPDAPLAVWLALGAAPYPVLLGAGAWYVRRAERNEGDVTGR